MMCGRSALRRFAHVTVAGDSSTSLLNRNPLRLGGRCLSTVKIPTKPRIGQVDPAVVDHERAIQRVRHPPYAGLTNAKVKVQQNRLFDAEQKRQRQLAMKAIEKIEVLYRGLFDEDGSTLVMNNNASTPFECGQHINEAICKDAAIALVDGAPWDMHRPLSTDSGGCQVDYVFFRNENSTPANKALWRTGSFLLGYLAEKCLDERYFVELHSWPAPDIASGSFVIDADLKIPEWTPRSDELIAMNLVLSRLIATRKRIEPLDVPAELAQKMFKENRFKSQQIPNIAERATPRPGYVTLYRVDDHIDISCGPMLSHVAQIGRHQITAVQAIDCTGIGMLYRLQGVALPSHQALNYFTWKIIVERARHFNPAPLPGEAECSLESLERLVEDDTIETDLEVDQYLAEKSQDLPKKSILDTQPGERKRPPKHWFFHTKI